MENTQTNDQKILNINKNICKNIANLKYSERGFICQNILAQLRNFVEQIAIKEYLNLQQDFNSNNVREYDLICKALNAIKTRGDLNFLNSFHAMLTISVSHYTFCEELSERLMLKYYEYLLKIKEHLLHKHSISVLTNLNEFLHNNDREQYDFYEKIVERFNYPGTKSYTVKNNERYYVNKIKPFFVRNKIYYEVTFRTAFSQTSKYEHVIAFASFEIFSNYAVKFKLRKDYISILDQEMEILVIEGYEISIRPCEWDNLLKVFNAEVQPKVNINEYKSLMNFIYNYRISLITMVETDECIYNQNKSQLAANGTSTRILDLLDKCRNIIVNNYPGANTLRYLLYKMNNQVIKRQYSNQKCDLLSGLYLKPGCIPFDQMPYCSSLPGHNPLKYDLFDSIPIHNREHELFARFINNKTEIEGVLFTSRTEIEGFTNIDDLINKFNQGLYYKHKNRAIATFKDFIYIKGYVDACSVIINKLQKLASLGVPEYTSSIDSWISKNRSMFDDNNKIQVLRSLFANSHVAFIYGAAGTGKSTLIGYIANFWSDKNKIFLANTHVAVNNLRRKVIAENSAYHTIKSIILSKTLRSCEVLFIDECSTVSNREMKDLFDKVSFKILVLVGDIHQIESIRFGNWFTISQRFVPKSSVYELTKPFRTTNNRLCTLWDKVRQMKDSILESLVHGEYTAPLDASIFQHSEIDEIVLCFNYDGLYGINNINLLMQNNNPNIAFDWGVGTYKVGDPVLFNESSNFSSIVHNNSKGKIVDIRLSEQEIWFDIELECLLKERTQNRSDFRLIGTSESGNSIISLRVNKYKSTDDDDDEWDLTVVPFQVAYAVSIHKSQGLEYDSVKIVISNEIEELITHNILYTAITRAKRSLKIYWSPETENAVLGRIKTRNVNRDVNLLKNLLDIDKLC